MKFNLGFVVGAFLLLHFAVAKASSTMPGPEHGVIVNSTYRNDSLGFSFSIPDGWQVNRDAFGVERAGEAKQLPGGGLELLILDRHTGRHFRDRIVMCALDARGMTSTTTQRFVSAMVDGSKEQQADWELIRETHPIDLAGRRFFREDYRQSVPEGTIYKAFIATRFRGYFLGWYLIAGSVEDLEQVVRSLQKLSFNDPPAVHISSRLSQTLRIKKVQPQYPEVARRSRIQGNVVLKALIDENGDVRDLTLISGHPLLAPMAAEAVKQWKYKPYLLNGNPVAVETQIVVSFSLNGAVVSP